MADTGSSTDLESEREFLAKQVASARKFLDDTMAATGEMLDLLDNEAALMKKKLELERTTKSQSAYMELLDAAGNLMYSEMKLMEEVDELKARVDQLTRRNRSIHNKDMKVRDKLRSRKDELEKEVRDLRSDMAEMKAQNYETQISQKNSDLHVRDNTIAALAEELASVKADANNLSNRSLSRVRKYRILKNNLKEKDAEIGNLKEQVHRLQEELRYFHGEHDTLDNM